MTLNLIDVIFLICDLIIMVSYFLIGRAWFFLSGDIPWMAPPSLRKMMGAMLVIDGITYLLTSIARVWLDFTNVSVIFHVALAIIAAVTALTVVNRIRILGQLRQ